MSFDLEIVEQETRKVEVKYGEQTLEAYYRPGVITSAWLTRMQAMEKEDDLESGAKAAADLLDGWNMTRNGKPVEPSFDVMRVLPVDLLSAIFDACVKDSSAGEAQKTR